MDVCVCIYMYAGSLYIELIHGDVQTIYRDDTQKYGTGACRSERVLCAEVILCGNLKSVAKVKLPQCCFNLYKR